MKTKQVATVFIFSFLFALVCKAQPTVTPKAPAETKFPEASAFEKSKMTCKVIDAPNKTFGYDIFADGKLLIHQASVPGMPGNNGFTTKEGAEKVGQLVIGKIKKGEMPPTVSKEEMQKLKAIK